MSKYGRLGALWRKWTARSDLERHANDIFNIGGSTIDLLKAIHQKNQVRESFLQAWGDSQIDVLITPVTPFTAPLQKSDNYLMTQLTFCGFPNVL